MHRAVCLRLVCIIGGMSEQTVDSAFGGSKDVCVLRLGRCHRPQPWWADKKHVDCDTSQLDMQDFFQQWEYTQRKLS
jgi:hypothetical protein